MLKWIALCRHEHCRVLCWRGRGTDSGDGEECDGNQNGIIVIGGGCFWCMEAVFDHVPGVKSVVCGYAGGHTKNPTYEEVCTDATDMRRSCASSLTRPSCVGAVARRILQRARSDDPEPAGRRRGHANTGRSSSTPMRPSGRRPRSRRPPRKRGIPDPIVTEIVPLKEFYPAEEYHQHYFAKNPNAGYCRVVIKPKVAKLQHAGVIGK